MAAFFAWYCIWKANLKFTFLYSVIVQGEIGITETFRYPLRSADSFPIIFVKRYTVAFAYHAACFWLFLFCIERKKNKTSVGFLLKGTWAEWKISFYYYLFLLAKPGVKTIESENSSFFIVQAEGSREWTEIGHIVFARPGQWGISWSGQTLMGSSFGEECFRKFRRQDLWCRAACKILKKHQSVVFVLL